MTQTTSPSTAALSSKWQPYPAYKDSGVEWLGEIPDHWEVKRLKFTSQVNPSKSDISHLPIDTEVSFLPMERIGEDGTTSLEETRLIEQVRQGYTYFQDGDVIIAKITPCFENGKGALCNGLVNGIGFGTTELYVLRVNKGNDPKFFFYLTKSEPFREIGAAMMYGAAGQQRVPEDFVSNFRIGLPSLSEQQAIATFLDRETERVNALIVKKERLIALLQEKRAALISHAVTKGLDPVAPMKDSGVEWLGEIPAHWESLDLRRVITAFVDYRGATPVKATSGIPLITARNIKNGIIDFTLSQEFIHEEDYANRMVRGFPEIGDVLITTEAPLGESAQIVDEKIALAQRIILLKANKSLIANNYLRYYFMSEAGKGELWSRATGSTAIGIKASHLKEISITIPPLSEQQAIVSYLDYETVRIDALIARVREGIAKVQEYSAALIAAAVTGKIDVREVV